MISLKHDINATFLNYFTSLDEKIVEIHGKVVILMEIIKNILLSRIEETTEATRV